MLGLLCTTAPLRFQLPPGLLTRTLQLGARQAARRLPRQAARRMAVPMPLPVALPMTSAMAVPMHRSAPSRAALLVAAAALMLASAGLWRQEHVVTITRIALDGLRDHQAVALDLDGADRPAMDPSLAWVLDPRSRPAQPGSGRLRRIGVQPFEYQVRENESLQEIATRFGTDVSALLWNNGLDAPEQVQAGARLMILPVRGVLHLVKADETAAGSKTSSRRTRWSSQTGCWRARFWWWPAAACRCRRR